MKLFPRLVGPNRTLVQTLCVVAIMTSAGFAAVPMYDWFCKTTGFGGTPLRADANDNAVLDETIRVRFDVTIDAGLPWDIAPVERVIELPIGQTGLAFYEATNRSDQTIAGFAGYNIAPFAADGFFTKIQCFCFDLQVLEPGETVQMPVSFFVDPAIVEDGEGQYVHTITLSYTFYPTELPEDHVAPAAVPAPDEQASLTLPDALTSPRPRVIDQN